MNQTNDGLGGDFRIAVAQTGFQGMAGQKNDSESRKERPTAATAGRDGIILPPDPAIPRQVAPQQSLLPFHRTAKCAICSAECHEIFKTRQTRLPGPGSVNSPGTGRRNSVSPCNDVRFTAKQNNANQHSAAKSNFHRLVLTRPSVAGFNAPPDTNDESANSN